MNPIEDPDNTLLVVCGPTAGIPGAVMMTLECGHEGAVSPATVEYMLEQDETIYRACIPCAIEIAKAEEIKGAPIDLIPTTEAQNDELMKLGVSEVDISRARKLFNELFRP